MGNGRYDIDEDEIKPHRQLDKIRGAMFWSAGQVFGLVSSRLSGVPVAHPSVGVYQVRRRGQYIGLRYFNRFAWAGKSPGTWMNAYRNQVGFRGRATPIVSNNANFSPGQPGAPVLVSCGDAVTVFHEFCHALQGVLSQLRYPSMAKPAVLGDLWEFPSQLFEYWRPSREVPGRFALHHQTGQTMPPELVGMVLRAKRFNQGFLTAEYLASAIDAMSIHLAGAGGQPVNAGQFERQTLADIGCPPEVVMRHRPAHVGHIFSGEGYSAGDDNHRWADALTADAAEAFTEAGGFFNKALSSRLETRSLRVGNSMQPNVA